MIRTTRNIFYFAVIFCLGVLFFRSYVLFNSKFYGSGAESIGLYGILDVSEGKTIYRSPQERPYSVYVFTPVYPLALGSLLKMGHISELSLKVTIIKAVGVLLAAVLFYLVWLGSLNFGVKSLPLLVVGLILSSSRLFDYIGTTRNDVVALITEFCSLLVFSKFIEKKNIKWLLFFVAFSCLGVWTRQTATIVFAAGVLWLLLNRYFKYAVMSSLSWGLVNLIVLAGMVNHYGLSLFDHILFSNIRLWKEINGSLITISLLSFLASITAFTLLVVLGFKQKNNWKGSVRQFYFLCFVIGLLIGTVSFFRAGGDVNYLFFPLLVGTYFTLTGLSQWLEKPITTIFLATQIFVICFIYIQKSRIALGYAHLPFVEIATEIEKKYPAPGLIVGHYAQNMGIHLKNWAHHGPDLTNGTMLALSAHKKIHWLMEDAENAIREKKVNVLLDVHPNCSAGPSLNSEWFKDFHKREVMADWACVYTR